MNLSHEDIAIVIPTVSTVEFETTPEAEAYDIADPEKMQFIIIGILGTIIIVFGTFGNILSIIVWTRRSMRSTTGTYLIALAGANLGHLLLFFFTDGIQILCPEIKKVPSYGLFYSYIGFPLFMLFVSCSAWVTVGMTADRCIKVCWIYLAQSMCSQKRALQCLCLIALSSILINIPHFLVFEPVAYGQRNLTTVMFQLTEFGATDGRWQYEFWIQCMFLVIIPVVSIFIFNMFIICRVRTINRQIGSKKGAVAKERSMKSEAQLTRLLLTVTFTYLVLNSFHCIVTCFAMLNAGDPSVVAVAVKFTRIGEIINSSVNFLLYCISGKRFRKEVWKIFCGKCIDVEERSTTYTTTTTSSASTTTITTTFRDDKN